MTDAITKAHVSFNSKPTVTVAGQKREFGEITVTDRFGNTKTIQAVDMGNNTLAKLKQRPDGKYDVVLFKKDHSAISDTAVKIRGGTVSRLKTADQTHSHNKPETLNDKTLKFDDAFAKEFFNQASAAVRKHEQQKSEDNPSQTSGDIENKKWQQEIKKKFGDKPKVETVLNNFGYELKQILGDGDCFYNSIRRATKDNNIQLTRNNVHAGVGDFLSKLDNNAKIFYEELQQRYNNNFIKTPASGSNDQNAYGMMLECNAVAQTYQRPVVVFQREHPADDAINIKFRPKSYLPDGSTKELAWGEKIPENAIVLIHSGGNHWDSALPK